MSEVEEDKRSVPPAEALGGLFDGFEAYRTPADADYRSVLTSGMVVPDANVLLNLYRYNEQTRNDLLSALSKVRQCLWVPHQVMCEFWRNRERVLQDPRDTEKTENELIAQRERTIAIIRSWANRVRLPQEDQSDLSAALAEAFDSAIEGVRRLADDNATEFSRDTNRDPVLSKLESLLRDRVGDPFSAGQYKEVLAEARRRGEAKIPPGYKDFGKGGDWFAGDYLIWAQILTMVRRSPKDVIIVTGDAKDDWWRRERGELRGPRPELAEELRAAAGVKLFMVRPESLLELAQRILRIRIHDESLEDIVQTDRHLAAALQLSTDIVEKAWVEVLDALKERRRVAWMILSNGTVSSLDGDLLSIEFRRPGDLKGFLASGCEADLVAVLYDVLGIHLRIAAAVQPEPSVAGFAAGAAGDPWGGGTDQFSDEPPF